MEILKVDEWHAWPAVVGAWCMEACGSGDAFWSRCMGLCMHVQGCQSQNDAWIRPWLDMVRCDAGVDWLDALALCCGVAHAMVVHATLCMQSRKHKHAGMFLHRFGTSQDMDVSHEMHASPPRYLACTCQDVGLADDSTSKSLPSSPSPGPRKRTRTTRPIAAT